MKKLAIKAENISKQYRIGEVGSGTISHDLNRFWSKIRGKEDPYLKIDESNNNNKNRSSDYVWSLRDINFEIQQGDAVGIIGRNGAGKSTLLKLLSKVTKPTKGTFKINGRIASLLEVGTGFNPEMTGRENIYLNAAILGMRKHEISRRFDEIVDFSGVERYIDTPVKRYSSGMYVRLAFAVAAHLESEILIVDEVLAVGDAEFQKKCLGKMDEVTKGEGRTVLFVSHQLGSVVTLCNKGMLMEKGKVIQYGDTNTIIDLYMNPNKNDPALRNAYSFDDKFTNKKIYFTSIETLHENGFNTDSFGFNETIVLKIKLVIKTDIRNIVLGIGLQDKFNIRVCTFMKNLTDVIVQVDNEECLIQVAMPKEIIAPNFYNFILTLYTYGGATYDVVENICPIKIFDTGTIFAKYEGIDYGNIIVESKWEVLKSK